jgi:hypothetical protein
MYEYYAVTTTDLYCVVFSPSIVNIILYQETCTCPRHCNVSISITWRDVLSPGQVEQLQEMRRRLTSAAVRFHSWSLGSSEVEANALVFNMDKATEICTRLEEQVQDRVDAILGRSRDPRVNVRPSKSRKPLTHIYRALKRYDQLSLIGFANLQDYFSTVGKILLLRPQT